MFNLGILYLDAAEFPGMTKLQQLQAAYRREQRERSVAKSRNVMALCRSYVRRLTAMQKKLTITIDEEVYKGLHAVIGRGRISRFLEDLARPHVVSRELDAAYKEMAGDEVRESDAEEWAEGLIGDIADDTR